MAETDDDAEFADARKENEAAADDIEERECGGVVAEDEDEAVLEVDARL